MCFEGGFMKVIVIERFRDLTVKSKEYPQGKDREINEILDVEESRGKILLDKGWVKVEDNTQKDSDDEKTTEDTNSDNHNTEDNGSNEKTTEDTNSDNHDTEDNDSDEKTIEDTNSDKVKSENK